MGKAAIIFFLTALTCTGYAGGDARRAGRQEYKQSKTYPYIFEPVAYLTNGGPVAMRFGPPTDACTNHTPPALPKEKKADAADKPAKGTAEPAATPKPEPTPPVSDKQATSADPANALESRTPKMQDLNIGPAFPPPENAPIVSKEETLDMSKYPAEVIDILKNPYNVPKSHTRFFDPVFEPAQIQTGPASKATFREE
jgi:hypothetical protein